MDYEKKYKDALERANSLLSGNELGNAWIYKLFPELKEPEDEKIRKEIIYHIQHCDDTIDEVAEKRMLAWLEKQGESDETKAKTFLINKGYPIDTNGIFPTYEEMYNIIREGLEKQGEKSLTVDIESMVEAYEQKLLNQCNGVRNSPLVNMCVTAFKHGVENALDELHLKQGEQKQDPCEKCDHFTLNCHNFPCTKKETFDQGKSALEAIKEEKVDNANKVEPKFKVGDWVVQQGVGLFKIIEVCKFGYEVIDCMNKRYSIPFLLENECHLWAIQDSKPGDVLAFDNGTIVIFKDLYNSKSFHSYCHIEDGIFDVNKDEFPDWWKGEGFKPATKEQRDILMKAMYDAGYTFNFEKKELKKIHVIDEGKAEMDYCFTKMMNGEKVSSAWSEEDEKIIQNLLSLWEEIMIEPTCCRFGLHKDKIVEWLKSLKDRVQPQWKPKGIHLEALRCVINGNNLDIIALKDLLEQLKKL